MAHFFAALLAILQPGKHRSALPPLDARWSVTFNSVPAATPGYDAASAYIPAQRWTARRGQSRPRHDPVDAGHRHRVTPASGEGLVFIVGDQTIEARDAETSANRWSTPLPGGAAVPLFYDTGWLLASTTSGDLIALRASDGAVVWRRPVGCAVGRTAGTGARRAVCLSLEDNRLVSVLLTNGEMVWARVMPARDRSARARRPARGRHRRQRVMSINLDNGRERWDWGLAVTFSGIPAADDKRIYFAAARQRAARARSQERQLALEVNLPSPGRRPVDRPTRC